MGSKTQSREASGALLPRRGEAAARQRLPFLCACAWPQSTALYLMPEEPFLPLFPDRKHFKTCTYSLGIRSFHPSANKLRTPLLHGHRKGKRGVKRGREGRIPGTDDLMHRASAQELLAQCLSSSLLLEKEESKRWSPFPGFVLSFRPLHAGLARIPGTRLFKKEGRSDVWRISSLRTGSALDSVPSTFIIWNRFRWLFITESPESPSGEWV